MGSTSYIGWAVLMASQILFSQLLGVVLEEWKGSGRKALGLLVSVLCILIISAILADYASL